MMPGTVRRALPLSTRVNRKTTTMPIWLLSVWHWLKIAGVWIKGNWILLLLAAGMVFALVAAKNKAANYETLLKAFQDQQTQNARELDELRKIQQDQIQKQLDIDRKYQEVLDKIQKDYQDQLHALDAKKQQELRAIIAANHDDPASMASAINGLFGIPIYTIPNS
jgi:sensor histidine kinase YesM